MRTISIVQGSNERKERADDNRQDAEAQMGIVIACLCRKSESGQKRWLSWLSRVKSWFASHVERLECPKR